MNEPYSAKVAYYEGSSREDYERARFSGLKGRYLYNREQNAVRDLIKAVPDGATVVDCPCGNGRWWPVLATRAKKIIALDVSEGMIGHAEEQKKALDIEIELSLGDAENLSLEDMSADFVFSFALTKHLPVPLQYKVLKEFSRVSKTGVICTFGIFNHLTYAIWRRRKLEESYPVLLEELWWMADAAHLKIEKMERCTTPIGVEHVVLFKKK